MYQGKTPVLNPEQNERDREKIIAYRSGAIANSFVELEGIINKTELARQYFNRSQSWLSQRINGSLVNDTRQEFDSSEACQLAKAFRDIARRLESLAGEIEAVAEID